MDLSTLEKYDLQKMYKVYDRWPEIAKTSYENSLEEISIKKTNHIVFAGMGGSGSICDVFASILSKSKIHVSVTKGYHLPKTVDENTVVVVVSVSGNTSEVLSILQSAKKIDCKIIAFSSGGKVKEFCEKNQVDYRNIEMIHSARASFVSFLYSMIKILQPIIPISKNEIDESLKLLKKTRDLINSEFLTNDNPSLKLAEWIKGIPVIYYPFGLQASAIRFKNSLQENSKLHASAEDVIEACHNGVVAWEQNSYVQPILLRGQDDHHKTKERWDILEKFFDGKGIEFKKLISVKGSILSKLINLIYILDYSTIYKAVMSGINPSPVNSIDFIKHRIC